MTGLTSEFANAVSALVGFSLLGKHLGPDEYGSFVAMYALIGIVSCLAFAGPGLAMLQIGMQTNLGEVSRRFYSQQLVLTILSAGVALALTPILIPNIGIVVFCFFLAAELIGTALTTLAGNLRIVATGYRSSIQQQVLPQAVKIAVVVALASVGHLTLTVYGFVFMVCSIGAGAWTFLVTVRQLGLTRRFGRLRMSDLRTTLSMSSTFWAWGLHDGGDKLVMSAVQVGPDLGLYAAAYKLVQFANVPVNALMASSFRSFLDPTIGNQAKRAVRYTAVMTVYTTCAAVGIIVLAPIALPILVGNSFHGSIAMARWLAPLLIVRGLLIFPGNALVGMGRVHARFLAYCSSAAVGMLTYIVLIPRISWKGGVIGSYVADAFLVTVLWALMLHTHRSSDHRPAPQPELAPEPAQPSA
jgi:O-antigen/teichoic acid export membrane protein